jgi:hypothetical protein
MGRGRDTDKIGCNIGTLVVSLNHVDKGRDPSKVDNGIVVVNGDGREVVRCGVGEGSNSGHQVVSPGFHGVREQRVSFPIAQDGATQRSGAKHLLWNPELVSPSLRWWSLSRSVSQTMRGVKETNFLVGADDRDRFQRRWSFSST